MAKKCQLNPFKEIFGIFNKLQNCADEFEECPEWSKTYGCIDNQVELSLYCRKTCANCGFLSREYAFDIIPLLQIARELFPTNLFTFKLETKSLKWFKPGVTLI